MKKTIYLSLTILVILVNHHVKSQISISENGNAPDSSAILDLQSTNKGLLIPRLTTVQMYLIDDPATGLIVFNTDSLNIYFFSGSYWFGLHDTDDTLDPTEWICGTPVDYEGQSYSTIEIGDQCWFAENLNVGKRIDSTSNQTDNDTIEKYCYRDSIEYCDTYGGLYIWDEMMQYSTDTAVQGICPDGWHVSTNHEWKILEGTVDSLYGVGDPEWDIKGFRGYDAGHNLKSQKGWGSGFNGSDAYGFTALPGGYRSYATSYGSLGEYGYWWTSFEYDTDNGWNRNLYSGYRDICQHENVKSFGFSVRCLKDD